MCSTRPITSRRRRCSRARCAAISRSTGTGTASGGSPRRSSPISRGGWHGRNWSMARLPAAEWTQREGLAALVAALGRDNIRWVGGAVRDTLTGRPVADVDAATPLRPEDVMQRLGKAGIRTVPTGIDHGTVTALFDDGNVEITTLRRDVSTDGRRA